MRRFKKGPLVMAIAIPVLLAVLGGALVGDSGLGWYAELAKPWFLVPLWVFYVVGLAYYLLGAVVLYRILAHVTDHRSKAISLALAVGVLVGNELWNYGFFGMRSTLAGFVGMVVFLVALTALIVALGKYERVSAGLLIPYYLWVRLCQLKTPQREVNESSQLSRRVVRFQPQLARPLTSRHVWKRCAISCR